MPDEYPTCVNCGERIQTINFALGPEWRHWPTPHGNYQTNELYRYCRTAALVATPEPDRAVLESFISLGSESKGSYALAVELERQDPHADEQTDCGGWEDH